MSKDELIDLAEQTTPQSVQIPPTWTGLVVWAISKWGVGIVGFLMVIPLYQDLKASNEKMATLSGANIQVLQALAQKVEDGNQRTSRLEDAIRRLETSKP